MELFPTFVGSCASDQVTNMRHFQDVTFSDSLTTNKTLIELYVRRRRRNWFGIDGFTPFANSNRGLTALHPCEISIDDEGAAMLADADDQFEMRG
jgi:hypothetical protein